MVRDEITSVLYRLTMSTTTDNYAPLLWPDGTVRPSHIDPAHESGRVPLRYTRPDGEPAVMGELGPDWITCAYCRSIIMREGYHRWYSWAYCLNPECAQYLTLVAVD